LPSAERGAMNESVTDRQSTPESERDALRVLVDNHRQFLAFLERRVGSRALAEDILQEAFVRGIDRADQLRSDESAVAWFYRVLRNAMIDSHRRRASAERGAAAFATEQAHALEAELAAAPARGGALHDTVCRCVAELAATLKPEYASALRRIEVEGVAVKDYAAESGISRNTAAVRVHRARAALKKQVARVCGTCAEHGCSNCTCSRRASDSG
jgi:RNA polymerase sigma factor (sigma-70 family)